MDRYSAYDDFAQAYNRYWGGFSVQIMPILEQLALGDCPPQSAILDLCCGTGQLAKELTARGYRVIGVDGSEQMLRYARQNAPRADFYCADARSFDLPTDFAVVLSAYDSLNHLLTLEDLATVFRNVYRHLRAEGVFVFDMNLAAGFRQRWVGSFNIVSDSPAVVVNASYDEDEHLATMVMTLFTRVDDGSSLWRRNDVTLTQRAYSVEELKETLAGAAFKEIEIFDARRDFAMRDEGRAFVRAIKR